MPSRATTSLPYTELEVATGNFDTSRTTIDRIIIHTMVGTAESAASRFDTYGTQVSAHYGVKLDGSLIHWLEEFNTAYHAGSYSMNQRSIGIEHEDNGDYNGTRPDILYAESAKLVNDICKFYNIPIDRTHILKHSEVIPTGCPDALDIDRIVRQAAALNNPPDTMAVITQKELDQLRTDRDNNWNLYQTEIKKTQDLQNQLTECQSKQPSAPSPSVPARETIPSAPSNQPISNAATNSKTQSNWLTSFLAWLNK